MKNEKIKANVLVKMISTIINDFELTNQDQVDEIMRLIRSLGVELDESLYIK